MFTSICAIASLVSVSGVLYHNRQLMTRALDSCMGKHPDLCCVLLQLGKMCVIVFTISINCSLGCSVQQFCPGHTKCTHCYSGPGGRQRRALIFPPNSYQVLSTRVQHHFVSGEKLPHSFIFPAELTSEAATSEYLNQNKYNARVDQGPST